MKKARISIVIMSFIFGCALPKLGIEKQDMITPVIKTHGFYYNKLDYFYFMLHQNGVVRGGFFASEKNIGIIINRFTDSSKYKYDYKMPYAWGLFKINENKINIEMWESREWTKYGITKFSGIILNDSTLLIDHPSIGKDTFCFNYLLVKPDSTNKFIK